MKLYECESSNPKWNAQRNLSGRTHYVDDDTLRFHKSRVLASKHSHGGLIFYIIESYSMDWENTRRAFRGVIFDVYGTVLCRKNLDDGFRTREQAEKALQADLESIDPIAVTEAAIAQLDRNHAYEMQDARTKLDRIIAAKVAA